MVASRAMTATRTMPTSEADHDERMPQASSSPEPLESPGSAVGVGTRPFTAPRSTRRVTPGATSTDASSSSRATMRPQMPPTVTTSAPTAGDATPAWCRRTRCCCGRMSRNHMRAKTPMIGRKAATNKPQFEKRSPQVTAAWGRASVEQPGGALGDGDADVGESRRRGHSALGGAFQQAELEQERLVHVLHRLFLLADADGEGRQPHRPAAEAPADRVEDRPVELVEAERVDVVEGQALERRVPGDDARSADLGEVAHALQQPDGDTGRAARPRRDLGAAGGLEPHA